MVGVVVARGKRFRMPKIRTVIGEGTEIHGKVVFRDGFHLDGVIIGDVFSAEGDVKSTLIVSDSGSIKGNLKVANIILNGRVHGDVVAGRADLAPEARINGTLYYKLLEMAMGAEVNGKLIRLEGTKRKSEEPAGEEPLAEGRERRAVEHGQKGEEPQDGNS